MLAGLASGFEALGHEVTSLAKGRDPFFPNLQYDHDYSKALSPLLANRGLAARVESRLRREAVDIFLRMRLPRWIAEHDVFVFTWSSLLPKSRDLELIRAAGKQVVYLFIGSDGRYWRAFDQEYPQTHLPWPAYQRSEGLNAKLRFIRTIERHANTIHSLPDVSGLMLRPYYRTDVPFTVEGKPHHIPDSARPRIIHAPSKTDIKGTKLIVSAIEHLRGEGLEFEFLLLQNVPNSTVVEELSRGDIVLDQLYAHFPSMLALEGLTTGCAVAIPTYDDDSLFGAPICPIDEHTVVGQLRRLITDRDYRRTLAARGRQFVEENCAPPVVARKILAGLAGEGQRVTPRFFLERFELEPDQHLETDVKWLNDVSLRREFNGPELHEWRSRLAARRLL